MLNNVGVSIFNFALQREDLASANEMDVLPIKEEGTEEDTWNHGHQGQSESTRVELMDTWLLMTLTML